MRLRAGVFSLNRLKITGYELTLQLWSPKNILKNCFRFLLEFYFEKRTFQNGIYNTNTVNMCLHQYNISLWKYKDKNCPSNSKISNIWTFIETSPFKIQPGLSRQIEKARINFGKKIPISGKYGKWLFKIEKKTDKRKKNRFIRVTFFSAC